MSYILVAKGKQTLFFATEAAWALVSLIFAWFSIRWFGLNGAGISFVASYLVYGVLLICIVGRLSGFRWSIANRRTGLFFLCLIAVALAGFFLLPSIPAVILGGSAALLSLVYSIRILVNLIALDRLPRSIERLLRRLSLISAKVRHLD
jgi:PST family polysaccharide transporter